MAPQGTDFLRERPWFAKPLGQWGHLLPRRMLHSLGVCSSFIAVGMIGTLTEVTLGLRGGGVAAYSSRSQLVRAGKSRWEGLETAGHTTFSQEQRDMNECMLTHQLDLFHSYTAQGSAHEMVPPKYRVGGPTQLTLTGGTAG